MESIRRRSPVSLPATPLRVEDRYGWRVIREFENEAGPNRLIDVSHQPRWDIQDPGPADGLPPRLDIPPEPGSARISNDFLTARLNRSQAAVWQLRGEPAAMQHPSITETTEATLLVALIGPCAGSILEKLTALDVAGPGLRPPYVLQGPLCHVTVQLAVLGSGDAFLIAGPRGYARDLTDAILQAGKACDLRPAGEAAFETFIAGFHSESGSNPRSDDHER